MKTDQTRSFPRLALLLGVAGTILYHSSQFFSGFDKFFGDRGDVRGFVYFCEHWYQSILGKASLLSPGIFYPTKRTLAYSDLLFGFAAPYSFFRALGFNMFTSTELMIILLTFLAYCTAFVLLYRTLGFGLIPSCAGAMFYAFNSPKFNQLTHLQLQYVFLLPLIFALIITLAKQVETISDRKAAWLLSLAAVCLNVQLTTTFYYTWYFTLWILIFLLLALAFRASRNFIITNVWRFRRAIIIGSAVFLVGFIPIVLIYVPAIRVGSWYRFDFVIEMIPDWRSLLSMGDGNFVWGWFYKRIVGDPRPSTWGELMVGIGLVPSLAWIALTVGSIWLIKKGRRGVSPREVGPLFLGLMILATSIFIVIGVKVGGHSLWEYIYQYFPAARAIRAVSRYVIFLTLPMSIAFAYGLQKTLQFAVGRRALTVAVLLVAGFGVFEQFGLPKVNGTGFSTTVEEAYLKTMAARLPADCAAFYVAPGPNPRHSTAEYQYDGMMISAFSRVKTLNASSSQFPQGWDFYFFKNPDYESKVKEWIDSQKITGKVCRLELYPEVETFDPNLPSPVDAPEFFVRQLYRDFTNQEPESEVKAQLAKLTNCRAADNSCTREQIALNVFLSTGFHERGSFILRMYEAALGRLPHFDEFMSEMGQPRELTKEQIIAGLAARQSHQMPLDEKRVAELADSDEMMRRLGNRGFVALHYYGFLRREPDAAGLENWVALMDRSGDAAQVTKGIIDSVEYRQRFRN
ncbi:MAG TPA: DUF4214 domain-containing protein [Pyrinomonadaceae bacterium]|nr:DUF4214 domain-containing protein [Pyrinomonadaceae bacterium]